MTRISRVSIHVITKDKTTWSELSLIGVLNQELSAVLQLPISPPYHARDLWFSVDISGMIGSLGPISIGYLPPAPGSSPRSWHGSSISCSRRSAGNSSRRGAIDGEFDDNSWSQESTSLVRLRLCFTRKVAPKAPRAIASAMQPTTTPATPPWLSPDDDFTIDKFEEAAGTIEFDAVGLVVLEPVSFDLPSKISFKASVVHDGGYWLPLNFVRRNVISTIESMHKLYTVIFFDNIWGFISPYVGLVWVLKLQGRHVKYTDSLGPGIERITIIISQRLTRVFGV